MKREEELTVSVKNKITILSGPSTHICWTPDRNPNPEQVVLVRAADLLALEERVSALLPTPKPEADPIAWESMTSGYTKFVSEERYQKFSPTVRAWYKPYRCSSCSNVFADRHNDEAGECEAVEVEPEMVRKLRERIEAKGGAHEKWTADVINLVVAAREFWGIHNDLSSESTSLDKALEPFSFVPFENDPDAALTAKPTDGGGE